MDQNAIKRKTDKKSENKKLKLVPSGSNSGDNPSNERSLNTETLDPANVISFDNNLEDSIGKNQLEQIKEFVRQVRKNSDIDDNRNEMIELIDAEAYSQFNCRTKIKYFYLKHEWTFITIKESITMILFIISFILFYSSLKKDTNFNHYNMYLFYPMTFFSLVKCIISGAITGFILFCMYAKWIFLEHLLYVIIVYIVIVSKNHGVTISQHGTYNFYIFLYFTFFTFVVFLFIYLIYRLMRTKKYLYLIIAIFASFSLFIFTYKFQDSQKTKYSCENWDLSLNNTHIKKINNEMQIPYNSLCYMDKILNFFDLNSGKKCEKSSDEADAFYKSLRNYNIGFLGKLYGYPNTNTNNFISSSDKEFQKKVLSNLINVEKLTKNDIKPETILDFSSDQYGQLKINITKNENLSKERKEIEKNIKNKSLYKNILLIYLDSVSRAHFQRAMPKLSNFLQKFIRYEPFQTMKSFQYINYNSFSSSQSTNILPMFYGVSNKKSDTINSLQKIQNQGFITGYEIDKCTKKFYDVVENDNSVKWDHENIGYLCDVNYMDNKKNYYDSIYERCLYGKPISFYMIEYLKQFWNLYNDNKKYFHIAFNYGHEKTGNVLKYLDEPLYNVLNEFYSTGKFKDSAIFFVSNYGNQENGLYNILGSAEWEIEKKFGVFILLLCNNDNLKKGNYSKNLIDNQNLMITAYDIHDTMMHIIYGNTGDKNILSEYAKSNLSQSVLEAKKNVNRDCKNYKEFSKNYCKK